MTLKKIFIRSFLSVFIILISLDLFAIGVNDLQIIEKKVLDTSGFSCDLAMDPRNGNLHVLWVKDGDLKHIVRYFTGSWGNIETIDDGGRTVFGQEEANAARKCAVEKFSYEAYTENWYSFLQEAGNLSSSKS